MGKKSTTLGYRYLMTLFMGLCRGPVDAIMRIEVGGKVLYPRSEIERINPEFEWYVEDGVAYSVPLEPEYGPAVEQPEILTSTTVEIDAPDLFGGEEQGGEGGMIGTLQVMMGEPTQAVNPDLVELFQDELIGAFRGIVTLLYDGVISAYTPFPKPWRYRLRRVYMGWDGPVFYPGTAAIPMHSGVGVTLGPDGNPQWDIQAMNPAHVIYECMTNRLWGRGLPRELIDENSFVDSANTLFTENFGVCFKWSRQDTVEAFVQIVLDHIGAVLFTSRSTGEVNLRLIRGDYTVSALPVLSHDTGLLAITEDELAMPDSLVNEIIVDYIDPFDGEKRQTRAQNLALINSVGSIVSKSISYPGIPTAALANRVAQRDLKVHSTPLRKMRLEVSRAAWDVVPGDVLVLSDLSRGIEQLVIRVLTTSDKQDSVIELTAVQDVFGLPASSYASQPPATARPPQYPVPARHTAIYEVSYRELVAYVPQEVRDRLEDTDTLVFLVAARPLGLNTVGYTSMVGLVGSPAESGGAASWAPAAVVGTAVTPATTTINVFGADLPSTIPPNTPAYLGEEVVRIDSYDRATGVMTIARGLVDTIPQSHPSGTVLFLATGRVGISTSTYLDGQDVRGFALTRTPEGTLHPSLAVVATRELVGRHYRPYNVGRVRLAGEPFYAVTVLPEGIELTWAYRNRITQEDVLVPHETGTISPEAGTTVTINVLDPSDDSVIRSTTGITGTSWEYTEAMWATDGSPANVIFEVFTVRDGFDAWQHYRVPVTIVDASSAGWGGDWGGVWGG